MRLVKVMVLLGASVALADVESRFARLRDQAEPLSSMGPFIEQYAAECGEAGAQCEKNAAMFRKARGDKKYYVIIPEDSAGVLSMGEINPRTGTAVINMTPFLTGAASVLTHGAPSKTDVNGNPVLPYVRIMAKVPEAWTPAMMARLVASRTLRLQIVFTPIGLWTLPKKGGGTLKGVRARFDGVLVQVARTGEVLGTWYSP
jgi:hypothetical protein